MEVLVCLAEHPGEAVSKEKLLQTVWPNTFVSEDALKHCISELRRVFKDDAREPQIIETIPKRGYRLVAPVEPVNETKEPKATKSLTLKSKGTANRPSASKTMWWTGAIAIGAAMLILAVLITFRGSRSARASSFPVIHSLAVLPLQNLSADPSQEYFADGLTDELITQLAKLSSLRVVSRTSVMHYKNTERTVPEIARDLGVDAVLEGSIFRSGQRVRISAQLIFAATDKHLWADSYERDLRDVIALQMQLASTIAEKINLQLTSQESSRLRSAAMVTPEAYDAYLRGRFYWANQTEQGIREAITSFKDAIRLDPGYSPSYSGLAHAYQDLTYYVAPKRVLPQAEDAVVTALKINDCNAEAYTVLGWVKLHYDFDLDGAEAEYRRAIQCDPGAAETHDEFATYLDAMGRFDEALTEHRIALDHDPLSFLARIRYGDSFYYARHYGEAQVEYQDVLNLDPSFAEAHRALGWLYLQEGQSQAAIEEMKKAMELDRGSGLLLAISHALTGHTVEAKTALSRTLSYSQGHYISGVAVAFVYSAMQDEENTCRWLKQAYDDRDPDIAFFNVDPSLDPLRSNNCFRAIVRSAGLH